MRVHLLLLPTNGIALAGKVILKEIRHPPRPAWPSPTRTALAQPLGQRKPSRGRQRARITPGNTCQVTPERIENRIQGSTTLYWPATTHFVTRPPSYKFRQSPGYSFPRETVQEPVFAAPIFRETQGASSSSVLFPTAENQPPNHQEPSTRRLSKTLYYSSLLSLGYSATIITTSIFG
jgi:hypothetical protein